MSSPAEATPIATARWAEESWTAMVPLRRHWGMRHRLDAGAARLVPRDAPGPAGRFPAARPGAGQPAAGSAPIFARICLTSVMISVCLPGMSLLAKLSRMAST